MMPTFFLDIYKGWTRKRLKERCRELCRAVGEYEMMIAMLVEYGPEALQFLPPDMCERAIQLNAAYRDDDVIQQTTTRET
jgi:hypothetical protein